MKSKKQQKEDRELHKVYSQMSKERPHLCSGCGSPHNLTHSHIIPRSRRKDLVTDINNIQYHCMNCHRLWENHKTKPLLMDFTENMKYIEKVDKEYYELIRMKL